MKSTMQATLSPEDVGNILVTAFDGGYGGANYWVDNLDDEGTSLQVSITEDEAGNWSAVGLAPIGPDAGLYESVSLNAESISKAFNAILDGSFPIRSDLREQCVRSAAEGDLDIDADVADCIAQFVVFGELVYG